MDGYKKIAGIVFTGCIAFTIISCNVQSPGYVGLYVDNSTTVTDTTDLDVMPLNPEDTAMTHSVYTTAIDPDLMIPVEAYSDSAYQQDVKDLLMALTDSIHLLQTQMIELQKQITESTDTSVIGEQQQEFQPLDSLQPEVDIEKQYPFNRDTIALLHNQVTDIRKSSELKSDTIYDLKQTVEPIGNDSLQADHETIQMLQAQNDTMAALRKQLIELQNSGTNMSETDTVYVMNEPAKSSIAEGQQTNDLSQQQLRAKDEQIHMLQNRLNAMQNVADRTPQPIHSTREPLQIQPSISHQTDRSTIQLMQAQNDTIQNLHRQLYNLRLQNQARDTILIEREAGEMLDSEQDTSDLYYTLQDTMQLLQARVHSLEEQALPEKDTGQDEEEINIEKIDTTLIVAFYKIGKINPYEEASVLKQTKDLCNNNNVTKITLSGYTDSSGNEIINKTITNKRLNYLSEKIIPWISSEKIFFQNFGDSFASDSVVSDERRIEIRILTK